MRRRFNIVPFNHKPVKVDKELETKLCAEWPQILRWAIEGCLDWQRNGLIRPDVVAGATSIYFETQDLVGSWLEESCEVERRNSETTKRLFESYAAFADASGTAAGKAASFADELSKRGFERIKDKHGIRGRGFLGLKVRIADSWSQKYD